MKRSKKLGSKLIALMLALMMVAAYVPMVGDVAYAATEFTNDTVEDYYNAGDFENKWGVSLATDKYTYQEGEDIHVKVTGAFSGAWLGIYDKYSVDFNTTSMCGAYVSSDQNDFILYGENIDSSVTKNYELTPGAYYVIYVASDGRYAVLPIEVTGEGLTNIPAVATDKTTYKYGEDIYVTTPYKYKDTDWVGIYQKGQTPGSETPSISWYYIKDHVDGFYITDFANSHDAAVPEKQEDALFHDKLKSGEYSVYLCENDSYTVSKQVDITIEKEPYGEPEVTPAGCEKEGVSVQWYTDGTSESTPIAALQHQWSDYVYDADAKTHTRTCSTTEHAAEVGNCTFDVLGVPDETTTGTTTTYQCSVCKGTYTKTVASGFVFVETVTVEPTCTEAGETYELYRHETTREEKKVVLTTTPALNHDWDDWAPVGENATTHERVCKNDPEHKETKGCDRDNVLFRVNELVSACSVCGSEDAEVLLSMEKSVYGVDEDIIVKVNNPEGSNNWIGIFWGTDGHNGSTEYPNAPAKGWTYISSDEEEFNISDKTIWGGNGHSDRDTFINYNGKGQLMPGEWTVAIILNNANAEGQVSPYLRFTVCEHNWSENVLEAATCTKDGLKEMTCSSTCKETKTEVIPALDHDWDEGVVTKEATCSEAGSKTVTCQYNDAHTDTVPVAIDAEAHVWDDGVVTKAATCSEAGSKTVTCQYNDAHTDTVPVAIDAEAHAWDDGVITKAPTCSAEGIKTFTCKHNDAHTDTVPVAIDAEAHAWDDGVVTKAATCLAEGVKTFTCKHNDGHTYTGVIKIDPKAHNYKEVATAPTCTEKGYTTYTCECGDEYTAAWVDAAGHKPVKTEAKEATCEAAGNIEYYTCEACKKYFADAEGKTELAADKLAVEATGHALGEFKTVEKAGFGKEGKKEAKCAACDYVEAKTIAAAVVPTLKSYTFNNKTKTPTVTVKNTDGDNVKATRTFAKKTRKAVGKYNVTVKLTGADYEGSKVVSFKINPAGKSISKLSKGKKSFTVKWTKPSKTYRQQMTGYKIKYSTSSKMTSAKTVTVKSTTATSKTIKNLKAKKYYYVQIRTYKKIGSSYYYSGWSKVKKIKTK